MWPTSEQWGIPRIEPLYPVERMVFSRTITEPTNLRGHVEREATTAAMFMKYSSQETRVSPMANLLAENRLARSPPGEVAGARLARRSVRSVGTDQPTAGPAIQ